MTPHRFMALVPALLVIALMLAGCGHKHDHGHEAGDGHDHGAEKAEGKGDEHGHAEESPSGASFKAGKGVQVTDETKKILGVEVVEVSEQKLPVQIRFNVQVFGEKHRHAIRGDDHTGCDVHGSGFLPREQTASVRAGQGVQIQARTNANETMVGVVLAVEQALALGEAEVIVGLTNATDKVKPGEFLSAVITLPREEVVLVVPRAALLRTAGGTFVYAVNGDAYSRTAVKPGAEADGLVEITSGLRSGDAVVTKPVETLYLIELRATKGGGHSH